MSLTDMETDEIIDSLIAHIRGRMKELEADNRELRKHASNLAEFAINDLGDLDNPPPYEEMRIIWNTVSVEGMNAKRYLESKTRAQP